MTLAAKKMPSHSDRKARRTVFCVTDFSAPFCFSAHTPGKGGMHREPDRFHCVGAAVPGGVHYTGGSRCVFAAAAVAALHAAHPVRHGSGHYAGGQCVEPAAACYPARTDFAASGMDPIGSGACAWRSGPFAGGTVCRAAAGRRGRARRTHGAGCNIAQPARGWRALPLHWL